MIGSRLRPGFALPPPFSGDPILGCAFSGAIHSSASRVWTAGCGPDPTPRIGGQRRNRCTKGKMCKKWEGVHRMGRHNCARQRRAVRSVGQGAISPLDS